MISRDGGQLPVEIYLYPMILDAEMPAILAFFNQVDDRMMSFDKNMTPESDDFYADNINMLEFAPFTIMRFAADLSLGAVSASADYLFGIAREKVLQDSEAFYSIFSPYDSERLRKAVTEINEGQSGFRRLLDTKITTHKKEEKWVNIMVYPLQQGKRNAGVEIILEETSRIKQLENKLSSMHRAQIVSDLTKGLLHSLNNIINVVISRSQMILQLSEKKPVIDGINVIHDSALDGARQIRRVQEFIGQGDAIDVEESAELIEVIEDAVEFARIHFKVERQERGRDIRIKHQYYVKPYVFGNIRLVREILVGMIFRVSDEIRRKGQIEMTLRKNGDFYFSVTTEKKQNDEHRAAGREVYLSDAELRRLAERINARIFEEESAQTFSMKVVFPARMVRDQAAEEAPAPEYKIRDLDILVVEDEAALSEVLFELFDNMGNRVSVCSSGDAALNEFRSKKYDLVISDYGISGLTGIELLTRIKELDDSTVTVLFSGWVLGDIKGYKTTVDLFLPKPFQLDNLIREISRILKKKQKPGRG
jgi:CheY-like chemotaxis protein